mgnify:CR=1 FL=1
MRKLSLLVAGIALFAIAATNDNSATVETFSGTLVDTKCYSMMPDANKGNEHIVMKDGEKVKMPGCATACANMGIPVALLDDAGESHVLAVPATQLAEFMSLKARIEGQKKTGVLIPDKIEVQKDGKWKEVKIATMM